MALEKCKECGHDVSSTAKVCPNCGARVKKEISYKTGCLIILAVIIPFVIFLSNSPPPPEPTPFESTFSQPTIPHKNIINTNIPQFKVVAQDLTALSIIVPKNTTQTQLKSLIFKFREARKGNFLNTMIPPTTKGSPIGNYNIVWVFVFDDAEWATAEKFKRFMKSSLKNPQDKILDREYVKHIRGEYYYSSLEEYGNLGYDDGIVTSPGYKKLF